jgi:hypothetical protein
MELKIFEELFKLWERIFKLRNGFSLFAYIPTLLISVFIWHVLGRPIPPISLFLIAFLLHPPIFVGIILCCGILLYGTASERFIQSQRNRTGSSSKELQRSYRLYRLMRLLDKVCDFLPAPLLKKGIFVGHHLAREFYQDNRSFDGLNPWNSALDEEIGIRVRSQEKRLAEICQFVSCAFDVDDKTKQEKSLHSFVAMLPSDDNFQRMKLILQETYYDGEGFLSALLALYQTHFVLSLPEQHQQVVLNLLNSLGFEEFRFGWLGTRVAQAVLDGLFYQKQELQVVFHRLHSSTVECNSFFGSDMMTSSEILKAKYRGREIILSQIVSK